MSFIFMAQLERQLAPRLRIEMSACLGNGRGPPSAPVSCVTALLPCDHPTVSTATVVTGSGCCGSQLARRGQRRDSRNSETSGRGGSRPKQPAMPLGSAWSRWVRAEGRVGDTVWVWAEVGTAQSRRVG